MQLNTATSPLGAKQKPIGISATGLSLERNTTAEIDQPEQWPGQHGAAVLKDVFTAVSADDQITRDDAFARFLARLGPLTFTEGGTLIAKRLLLNCVSDVGSSLPPKSVLYTDTSYVVERAAYTALRALSLHKQDRKNRRLTTC